MLVGLTEKPVSVQDAQAMFDSSMTSAAIAEKVAELQKAAGITTQLVNPYGRGTSFITLTGWVALAALAALFIVIAGKQMLQAPVMLLVHL